MSSVMARARKDSPKKNSLRKWKITPLLISAISEVPTSHELDDGIPSVDSGQPQRKAEFTGLKYVQEP